jgi:flagellar biosynthetic protein FliQ
MAIELSRQTLATGLMLAVPILGVGLLVGLTIALLQAVTSVQEMTLTVVPKILIVAGALALLFPWMLRVAGEFTTRILVAMQTVPRVM